MEKALLRKTGGAVISGKLGEEIVEDLVSQALMAVEVDDYAGYGDNDPLGFMRQDSDPLVGRSQLWSRS